MNPMLVKLKLALIAGFCIGLVARSEAAEPPAVTQLGQLLIQDAQSGSPVRLHVARYDVHVVLQPPVALVQIDQSFYNPFDRQEEGQFVFNLPPGASVSRFAMYVSPTQLIEGELVERERASVIYQSIVTRRRDPAILEQLGDNLFKMRVFPIPARNEKRILLDFTVPLEVQAGQYEFRLPLLSDRTPIWDFRVSGVIRGAVQRESTTRASHAELEFQTRENGDVEFQLSKRNYRPETDLVLTFAERFDRPATLRAYVAEPLPLQPAVDPNVIEENPRPDEWTQRAAMYFLVEIPPDGPAEAAAIPPTDVLLLADTSSSIKDLTPVRRTVREIVHCLRPQDRVRLMCADVAARPLHDGWLKPDDATALERLDQEFALGRTDLDVCFRQAVTDFDDGATDRRRLVIYVGDGADAAPPVIERAVMQAAPEWLQDSRATLVAAAVQRTSSTTNYLRSLVETSGGLWFDVADDRAASIPWTRWLQNGLPSPVRIVDVQVEGTRPEDLFGARAWLPGEPLYIYGRTSEAAEVKLSLSLQQDQDVVTRDWTFPVNLRADDVFVGRLWAQQRLDRFQALDPQQDEVRRTIIGLSQEWSLLSPLTAFLVLETEQDYARWGLDRRVRRRYWRPADARPDVPLPADWVSQFRPLPTSEPSAPDYDEALRKAGTALAAHDFAAAHRLLLSVAKSPLAAESDEFQDLRRQTLDGLRRQSIAARSEARLELLDPGRGVTRSSLQPSVSTLLGSAFRAGPEFLRRHPFGQQLLRQIDLATLTEDTTLEKFADSLAQLTGAHVQLDRLALESVAMPLDRRLDSPTTWNPSGRISLKSGARYVLRQLGLVLVEEPHRLLITTPDEAESRLSTEVYPVADLLFTDHPTPLWLLVDPYLDHKERVRRRLESKLKQPLSIRCDEKPLDEVLVDVATTLDDTILIDHRALENVAVTIDTPVTATIDNLPAEQALEWLLHDLGLTFTIHEEALTVTTPDVAEDQMETRVHSVRGVMYEYPGVDVWQLPGIGGGFGGQTMGRMRGPNPPRTLGWGGGVFGGGMGAMGGFGGNMGGAGLGEGRESSATETGGASVGLSEGGVANAAASETAEQSVPASRPSVVPEPDRAVDAPPLVEDDRYVFDADALIEMIWSTISPDTWDDVGGQGSLQLFPYSLDLVLAQTRDVHEQVQRLLDRLRRLPPEIGAKSGARLATIAPSRLDGPWNVDFDTLIELITATVAADTWDDVGGEGSIEGELSRMALVVSQMPEIQDKLVELLTMLRRSRYETLHGSQPWEVSGSTGLRPAAAPVADDDGGAPSRLSDYPDAQQTELDALAVRPEPPDGQWQWRRVLPSGASDLIVLRLAGGRLQCDLPACTVRTEGDTAAVAWPGLRLVELGNYAEVLRQAVDLRLPWLPHRSRQELARLFDVFPVPPVEAPETTEDDAVWLRMVPAGVAREDNTYLQMAYSKKQGVPLAWESYVGGQLAARIRFAEQSSDNQRPAWRVAILEDASARELARWELVESPVTAGEIPALWDGWNGSVYLDRRAAQPVLDAPLVAALEAMRELDWAGASEQLSHLAEDRAWHPLVRLLQAWCLENDRRIGPHDRLVGQLLEVAQSDTPDLLRFVAEGNFPSLAAGERYAILALQPEATRTVEDCDRLTDAALAADKQPEALRHVEAALSRGARDGHEGDRHRRHIELLLGLGRASDAVAAARRWSDDPACGPLDLAAIAGLLASHAQQEAAELLFGRALADDSLTVEQRYALLERWASARLGVARCEKLLEAALLMPVGSLERRRSVDRIRQELTTGAQAETAAQLAAKTTDPELAGLLLLREAELTPSVPRSAQLLWDLYESDRLDHAQLAWACQVWNRSDQHARVIQACEQSLRAGHRLELEATEELAFAYRVERRDLDTKRALRRDPDPLEAGSGGR